MKVTPLTPEQKTARAKRKAQEQQQQQQQQQSGTDEVTTDVGKNIIHFAKKNPRLINQIKDRLESLIGISESVNGRYPMITEIFGRGKPKTNAGYDDIVKKWEAAGKPREVDELKKFLVGIGIGDQQIDTIFSNAGYKDPSAVRLKRLMDEEYSAMHQQLRTLAKQDKWLIIKEIKGILTMLDKMGAA